MDTNTDQLTLLKGKLYETIGWGLDKFRSGGDWATAKFPDASSDVMKFAQETAQQYAIYSAITHWLFVLFAFFLLFSSRYLFGLSHKKVELDPHSSESGVLTFIVGIVVGIVGIVIFCCHIADAVKATFAPKFFIIEKLFEFGSNFK